ncbi:hypothetical protein NPIL_408541 [Nephila pilipes]|uniref:Uncharacterized protein n=1 Tax=Nephila pilipes TaxID=299642 RepID=A0A8X6MA88_NEPPI|nr:hypothetical protein NPIL_408541 [Nephila pilipes]
MEKNSAECYVLKVSSLLYNSRNVQEVGLRLEEYKNSFLSTLLTSSIMQFIVSSFRFEQTTMDMTLFHKAVSHFHGLIMFCCDSVISDS